MADPKFETVRDIKERNKTIEYLSKKHGFFYKPAKKFSPYNYKLYRDELCTQPMSIAKVVTRSNATARYTDYFLSAKRVDRLKNIANTDGLKPLVIVRWKDQIGTMNLNVAEYTIQYGGRKERPSGIHGKNDLEPMSHFQFDRFRMEDHDIVSEEEDEPAPRRKPVEEPHNRYGS